MLRKCWVDKAAKTELNFSLLLFQSLYSSNVICTKENGLYLFIRILSLTEIHTYLHINFCGLSLDKTDYVVQIERWLSEDILHQRTFSRRKKNQETSNFWLVMENKKMRYAEASEGEIKKLFPACWCIEG